MISKKTKYALNALVYLARHQHKSPILISEIAENERIPQKFLEQILLDLKNNGILQSKKGKGGGYFLGRPAQEIMLGKVIRIFDGPLAPVSCVSQTAYMKCAECRDDSCCGIRMVMKGVREAISNILDKTSLADSLRLGDEAVQNKATNFII
jgi:Rrf2 family protein